MCEDFKATCIQQLFGNKKNVLLQGKNITVNAKKVFIIDKDSSRLLSTNFITGNNLILSSSADDPCDIEKKRYDTIKGSDKLDYKFLFDKKLKRSKVYDDLCNFCIEPTVNSNDDILSKKKYFLTDSAKKSSVEASNNYSFDNEINKEKEICVEDLCGETYKRQTYKCNEINDNEINKENEICVEDLSGETYKRQTYKCNCCNYNHKRKPVEGKNDIYCNFMKNNEEESKTKKGRVNNKSNEHKCNFNQLKLDECEFNKTENLSVVKCKHDANYLRRLCFAACMKMIFESSKLHEKLEEMNSDLKFFKKCHSSQSVQGNVSLANNVDVVSNYNKHDHSADSKFNRNDFESNKNYSSIKQHDTKTMHDNIESPCPKVNTETQTYESVFFSHDDNKNNKHSLNSKSDSKCNKNDDVQNSFKISEQILPCPCPKVNNETQTYETVFLCYKCRCNKQKTYLKLNNKFCKSKTYIVNNQFNSKTAPQKLQCQCSKVNSETQTYEPVLCCKCNKLKLNVQSIDLKSNSKFENNEKYDIINHCDNNVPQDLSNWLCKVNTETQTDELAFLCHKCNNKITFTKDLATDNQNTSLSNNNPFLFDIDSPPRRVSEELAMTKSTANEDINSNSKITCINCKTCSRIENGEKNDWNCYNDGTSRKKTVSENKN